MQLEQTLAHTPSPQPAAPVTDGEHDTLLGGVDTHALRNAIHRRVFGATVDPLRIGRFPILRRVGQGGMGVVYAAYDNELDRKVAIKLLRPGAHEDAEGLRARLLREAKALARLSDPGIVGVYEVGEHDGQIFVAMEFVEGRTLRQTTEEGERTPLELLGLYLQAARGLAAAHDAGIVHRDFKPDNAIVGKDGRVRVLDFGLATASDAPTEPPGAPALEAAVHERLTLTGAMLGTPAYMAPEQLMGGAADARSDQFSFAVALFEALVGERPFAGKTLAELAHAIAEARITVPTGRRIPARTMRALRRALQPDRAQRFPDMRALIAALDPGPRRAIGWIAGVTVGVLGLGLATQQLVATARERERSSALEVTAASLEITAASERDRADDAELRLQERADALTLAEARFELQRDPTRAVALLGNLSEGAQEWSDAAWKLAVEAHGLGVAERVIAAPPGYAIGRIVNEHRVVLDDPSTEVHRALWDPVTGNIRPLGPHHDGGFLMLNHDATMVALGGTDGIEVLELATGERRHLLEGRCVMPQFSHTSRFVAVTCSTAEETFWLVDLQERTERRIAGATRGIMLHVDETGDTLLTSGEGGKYRRWDTRKSSVREFGRSRQRTFAVSDDGRWLAGMDDDALELTDSETGAVRRIELGAEPSTAAFSHDLRRIAIGSADGEVVIADLAGDAPPRVLEGRHAERVEYMQWSEDDGTIDSAAKDGEVAVWAVVTAQRHARLRGLGGRVRLHRVDGERLMAASNDELRVWTVPGPRLVDADVVAFDERDGTRALVRADGRIVVGPTDGELRELGRHEGASWLVLADGGRVVTRDAASIQIRDASGRLVLDEPAADRRPSRPVTSADGRWVAWEAEGRVVALELASDRRIAVGTLGEHDMTQGVAFDGDRLIVTQARLEGTVRSFERIIELASGQELPTMPEPIMYEFDRIEWPGHGMLLGGSDALVLWNPRTATQRRVLEWKLSVPRLRLSPDGTKVAVAPIDGPTQLVDLRTGDAIVTHLGELAGRGNALMMIGTAAERQPIVRDDGTVLELDHGRLMAERMDVPREPAALRAWLAAATDLRARAGELGDAPK